MIERFRRGQEDKPAWRSVPKGVRAAVESALGSRVVSGRRVWGGYAPSATFRLSLESGGAAFFKGVDSTGNSFMRASMHREMLVYAELPGIAPWAPSLLGTVTIDDWRILLLEFVPDARGNAPWAERYVQAAIEGLADMHNAFAGQALPGWLRPAADTFLSPSRNEPAGWRSLEEDASAMNRLAALAGPSEGDASAWLKRFVARIAELEARISAAPGTPSLLHMDVRSDNLLFRKNGAPVLVDWPHVKSGPGVIDAVGFLITVTAEGGPGPEQMLSWYADALDSPISNEGLMSALAAFSGYFAARAGLPDIPGLPRLRSWQRAQLVVSMRWLAQLLDMPAPEWLSEIQFQQEAIVDPA